MAVTKAVESGTKTGIKCMGLIPNNKIAMGKPGASNSLRS
jgi:hypothetical protein